MRQAAAAFRAAHLRCVAQRLPALAAQHPRLRLVAVAFQSNVAPCSPAGGGAGQAVCRIIREALRLRAARRGRGDLGGLDPAAGFGSGEC